MAYRSAKPAASLTAVTLFITALSGCNTTKFTGSTSHDNPARQVEPPPSPPTAPAPGTSCSDSYQVPATANPYLAGAGADVTLDYSQWVKGGGNPLDTVSNAAPVLIKASNPLCLTPGHALSFSVSGQIAYDPGAAGTDGNGDTQKIVAHTLGSINGKSAITAPINALLGVFLGDNDPTHQAAPEALDFTTAAARDYLTLSPKLGQVFFIGNGKTNAGVNHQVIVPAGATQLYFAVMDGYQWNNNIGSLKGQITAE